jgi:hypothetical protein
MQNADYGRKLENLKINFRKAYAEVRKNKKKAQKVNKKYYDGKAKERKFEVDDKVYLFCPTKKPGRCQKFRKLWRGLYKILENISDLNYRIIDIAGREQVVHVNRLKISYVQRPWKF